MKKERAIGILHMITGRANQKKALILILNWIINCVIFYTLLMNVTELSGNVFINSALLVSLGELPGKLLIGMSLKYLSRRLNIFMCDFMAGLFLTILAFLPKI